MQWEIKCGHLNQSLIRHPNLHWCMAAEQMLKVVVSIQHSCLLLKIDTTMRESSM